MADHDGHTVNVIPVTVGTCGCSNNFGHTCEEVARLRAENAEIRGDNATLGSTVTGLRADNVTLRDLLAKALPRIVVVIHDDHLLTVAIREALGEGS